MERLLGGGTESGITGVRRAVAETALSTMAESFGADTVVICRRDRNGVPSVITSRVEAGWRSSTLAYEVFGQLWNLLANPRREDPVEVGRINGPPPGRTMAIEDRYVWLGRQPTAEGALVAAVVRRRRFTAAERVTLTRLVRSVAVAVGAGREPFADETEIAVVVKAFGRQRRSEVRIACGPQRCRAKATGETAELAVARAAAKLAPELGGVTYAGRVHAEGQTVSVVVAHDHLGSPLLGLSTAGGADRVGLVEAVFSAAAVAGPIARA